MGDNMKKENKLSVWEQMKKEKYDKRMKISPIFYMGNKKKLINKGLIELFPKNINIFFDVFSGSGIVSLNTEAKAHVLNDIDENVVRLFNMFKNNDSEYIVSRIEDNIEKYKLAKERTKRNEFFDEEKLKQYKQAYHSLRDEFNRSKNVFDFYTLMFYSFSQQFRFNNKGKFNMPCGNDYFSDKNKDYIKESEMFFRKESTIIRNKDFRYFHEKIWNIMPNDFVYLDPPYYNTTATYNENDSWSIKDDEDLFKFCEELHLRGLKFGMSNVFECKGNVNSHLIEWCKKNKWKVYVFDKFTYMACGKGNSNAKEVYICNYDI